MNTSEKIAEVVAQFLAADREEDRKRIAELERDAAILKRNLSQACKSVDELNDLVVDFNKQIDELTEKCAALVVENKRLSEYASGNLVDVPPPSDAGCLYPECGPTCRRDCPPSVRETPAVKRTPQVGDKVRIIVRTDLAKYGEVGEIGTVTQIDSGRTAWVDGVGVDGPWCHYIDNLEAIE